MDLAEVRLHGPHGSFQKSESRKWPNTIFTARCVLLEVHYTGSVTRCEARCVSLRQSASFVSASERQFCEVASERQFCQCDVCAEAPLPRRGGCDRAPAKMPSAYANGCVRAPFVFIGFLCRLMYPGSAEAVLSIRGSVGGPGRGEGGRRGLVPRLVQSGSRVALLPPIPTRTPSAAPLCVVPLSIPPLVVSGMALRLWLPLVAFVPLL